MSTHATTLHAKVSPKEEEYLDGWKRARAELENVKRRTSEDLERKTEQARREIVEELLAVSDNFGALSNQIPENIQNEAWVEGALHIKRQFEKALENFGVTTMAPKGEQFDPRLHEVVEQVSIKEVQSGLVAEVIQPGYMLGSLVVRPARVRVAK